MTGLLADAEDEQKALVVFVVIAKAFQEDDMFNLGDFFGRFRLYRLLLKSKLDPQKLKDHMNKILHDDYQPLPQCFGDKGWSISIQ